MKFMFTGKKSNTIRGVKFESGKPVEVKSKDLAAKLSNLSYFEQVEDDAENVA